MSRRERSKEFSGLPTETIAALRKKIKGWYAKHGRDLPWRSTSDPYPIWISEVMLQQTQVATVLPYFASFLGAFPTIFDLAAAEESKVFRYWEGLGYYRRARQLHAAAKRVVDEFEGKFPTNISDVQSLPGIGRYTAGAICSFAFDQSQPIVEANTQRLYARLLAIETELSTSENQAKLWAFAEQLIPVKGCGPFNHAIMDLGAMICKPQNPECSLCPIQDECKTFASGKQNSIPTPKRPKQYEARSELVALLQDSKGRWLLRKCEPGERWAGLWDFPRFDVTDCSSNEQIKTFVSQECFQRFGRHCNLLEKWKTIQHAVTRYRITLDCYRATWVSKGKILQENQEISWVETSCLNDFALSSTGRKISQWLAKAAAP